MPFFSFLNACTAHAANCGFLHNDPKMCFGGEFLVVPIFWVILPQVSIIIQQAD